MMTTDTSPEAVERMAQMLETDASDQHAQPCEMTGLMPEDEYEAADTLRALSAERDALKQSLEKAVMACGEQARARGEAEGRLAVSEMAGVVDSWKARAKAAEAERDALKAELAEAIEKAYREGWSDGSADEIHEYCSNPHDDWLVSDTRRADLCAKSEAISPTQDERVRALEAENARLREALSLIAVMGYSESLEVSKRIAELAVNQAREAVRETHALNARHQKEKNT